MRPNCLLALVFLLRIAIPFHVYLILIAQTFMKIGDPLWKHFDRKLLEPFYIAWRKCIRRVWKIPYTSYNVLIPYIHNTILINVILQKRCIKFI